MIRLEKSSDYLEVENLTREAFWNVYRPGCFEHLVLHNLRANDCFIPELDFVIEKDGKIIANIVYAKGNLTKDNGDKSNIIIFGPVSVLPEYQGKGYGEQIIEYSMNKAKEMGYPAVVITGNPEYYSRFGFESASKYGIYYEGMDKKEEVPYFMVKLLDEKRVIELKGVYSAPDCYMVDEKDVDKFDKRFPPKVKEVRPSQLG